MNISFTTSLAPNSGVTAIIGYSADGHFTTSPIDEKTLKKAIDAANFCGKVGRFLDVLTPPSGFDRIIIAGLGKESDFSPLVAQDMGGQLSLMLNTKKIENTICDLGAFACCDALALSSHVAYGVKLKNYMYNRYQTQDQQSRSLQNMAFVTSNPTEAEAHFHEQEVVADGILWARDLINEPGNKLYPQTLAEEAQKLSKLGVKVRVMGEKEMTKLGMGALLGVGYGSPHESKLIIMEWQGNPASSDVPLALVGKGVTFDTGGISLKPGASMDEMRGDMGGSAAVLGSMHAIAARKAPINVVAIVGSVENMPDGNAQKPGDIVTSLSGQTIEILNTDAEGRLVLADALYYCADQFNPRRIINFATLTGAIVIALGHEKAGLFANNDDIANGLLDAAKTAGEGLWRMPLSDEYDKQIDSPVADVQNLGKVARSAGSITAAQFLARFVKDTPWAHIDIAGTSWQPSPTRLSHKAGSGYGVALIDTYVRNLCKDS